MSSPPENESASRAGAPRRSPLQAAALAAVALLAAAVLGLVLGSSRLALSDVLGALLGQADAATTFIVREVRIPSIVLAGCVGAVLGASGAAMQGLLRNPLADPYLLGISGGAALAAACALGLAPEAWSAWLVPPAAFGGALAATGLIAGVARVLPGGLRGRSATYTLLLTGVVFNAFAGALILLLHTLLMPAQSQEILLWLMGAIVPARAAGGAAWLALVLGAAGVASLVALAPALNLLALGDDDAAALGLEPVQARRRVLLATAVAVGSAVAFTGLIGFVGLLVPHIVRLRAGADHRVVVPLAAVTGAAFLVVADAGARSLFPLAGNAIPVGVVTALVGVPLFFAVLTRHLQEAT